MNIWRMGIRDESIGTPSYDEDLVEYIKDNISFIK